MAPADTSGSTPPGGSGIRQWDGAMPILMSIAVLAMVAVEVWKHGPHAPRHDEGTADHIAMLLMYGQVPIMFWFAAAGSKRVLRILPVLALQLALWALTFAAAVKLT
jgi:hypothetical protein